MKTLAAVLVIMWSRGDGMRAEQIEMPTMAGCQAEASRINAETPRGLLTWVFCVERK